MPTACPSCALEFSGGEIFCPVDGSRLVSHAGSFSGFGSGERDPLLDQTLAGRYRILRKIGEGGMGIVYEAIHVVIEKSVALKVLREDFSHREDVVERFRQEAKSASRIGHEHIIDISDFGVTPSGAHFFVMELLHGRDLAEELELGGPLPTRRVLGIALQCAKALEAAHAKGIVHRDMKPENVFLTRRDTGEDFIKIVDFGIAKMSDMETGRALPGKKITKSGMIFGTPEYMSPEQAAGKALDHRVDVYALGIIMYELMTGRVPFMGDTFMGILTQHMFEQALPMRAAYPACTTPPEVEQMIMRSIAKNPDERPQTMGQFAAELSHLLAVVPVTSSMPPPGTLTHLDQRPVLLSRPPASGRPYEQARSAAPSYSEELTELRRPRSRLPWLAAALVLLSAVLGSALFLRTGAPETRVAVRAPVPPPTLPAALPTATPLTPVAAPPAAQTSPASGPVEVEVTSDPAGATVVVDGKSACPATPCRFTTVRNVPVQLVVQKVGYRSSRSELTPSGDHNPVTLTLSRRREGTRSGNRMDGDLMLPDAFGKR
jgi:serine/threonine protein kinase